MKRESSNDVYYRLLNDEKFMEWLIHPSEEGDRFWKNRMEQNVEERKAIQQLKQLLHTIKVEDKGLSPEEKHKLWESVNQATLPRKRSLFVRLYLKQGAAILLLLLLPAFYYLFRKDIPESGESTDEFFTEASVAVG